MGRSPKKGETLPKTFSRADQMKDDQTKDGWTVLKRILEDDWRRTETNVGVL